MPDIEEHDSDPIATPKLATALKDHHKARIFVPPEVDQAVLARAREHLQQMPKRQPGRRPLMPWAAMAASIVLVAWLVHTLTRPTAPTAFFAPEDINRDGRVDILDAFALTRQIESGATLDARWDITGDGRINRADVDAIASRAVSLAQASPEKRSANSGRPQRHITSPMQAEIRAPILRPSVPPARRWQHFSRTKEDRS
jgi:dockerin type I repeat protein